MKLPKPDKPFIFELRELLIAAMIITAVISSLITAVVIDRNHIITAKMMVKSYAAKAAKLASETCKPPQNAEERVMMWFDPELNLVRCQRMIPTGSVLK